MPKSQIFKSNPPTLNEFFLGQTFSPWHSYVQTHLNLLLYEDWMNFHLGAPPYCAQFQYQQNLVSEKSKSNHLCDTDSVTPLPLKSKLRSSCNGQMSLPWINLFLIVPNISSTLVIGNPSLGFIQEKYKYTLALEKNQHLEVIKDEKMRN